MKRFFTILITALLSVSVFAAAASAQNAQQIVDKADAAFSGGQVYSESTMTIYRNGREQPAQKMESYAMNVNGKYSSLTIYRSPARMKGTAYLMIEDDLWVRFSTTGRVRKMSSSAKKNSAGGSDLSYADMGDGNQGIAANYAVTLKDEEALDGTPCYVIELIPEADSDIPYEKLTAFISKENYRYLRIDYYEAGANIKTMTLGDYRKTGDTYYPFFMEMKSSTKDSRTVIETSLMEINSSKVQKRLFSTTYLESLQ